MKIHGLFAWLAKHKHVYVLIVIALLWVQVITQLFYPYDTALPGARLAEQNVAGKSRVAIAGDLQADFQGKTITFATSSSTVDVPLIQLGATLESDSMARELTEYPLWQRFIPFSAYVLRPQVSNYNLTFNKSILQKESKEISRILSIQPVNAGLAITKGKLVVTEAKDGQVVAAEKVAAKVESYNFSPEAGRVEVQSKVTEPEVKDASIAPVREKAQAMIARQYILRLPNGKEVIPSQKNVASWLKLKETSNGLDVILNKVALQRYIGTVNKSIYVAPTSGVVRLRDGNVTSRTAGTDGTTIDTNDLVTKLQNAANSNEPSVAMDVLTQPIAPSTVYTHTYSSSQSGLRAYVNYTTSSENVLIALQQIGGKGWSASGRATESIPSASTYKLFVALWLFDQMNKNKIHWNDPWLDTNVSGCFDRMTIASTNPCAVAWLDSYGRQKMNSFVYSKGFSVGTNFALPDATHSTAADLLKFMIGLNSGSLVGGAQRDRLLHSLSVHPFRYGVPTGSAGTVYDKVGFLWDYVHDAAIVRHPKGTYVVVIMTKGAGGYSRIAQITRELEGIMYP